MIQVSQWTKQKAKQKAKAKRQSQSAYSRRKNSIAPLDQEAIAIGGFGDGLSVGLSGGR
jgi:hypothetical protein